MQLCKAMSGLLQPFLLQISPAHQVVVSVQQSPGMPQSAILSEPAVGRDGDSQVPAVKRGDFVEQVRGAHDDLPLGQLEFERLERKRGLQMGVRRVQVGVRAAPGVEEPQYAATGLPGGSLARAYAVDRRPGSHREDVAYERSGVTGQV